MALNWQIIEAEICHYHVNCSFDLSLVFFFHFDSCKDRDNNKVIICCFDVFPLFFGPDCLAECVSGWWCWWRECFSESSQYQSLIQEQDLAFINHVIPEMRRCSRSHNQSSDTHFPPCLSPIPPSAVCWFLFSYLSQLQNTACLSLKVHPLFRQFPLFLFLCFFSSLCFTFLFFFHLYFFCFLSFLTSSSPPLTNQLQWGHHTSNENLTESSRGL